MAALCQYDACVYERHLHVARPIFLPHLSSNNRLPHTQLCLYQVTDLMCCMQEARAPRHARQVPATLLLRPLQPLRHPLTHPHIRATRRPTQAHTPQTIHPQVIRTTLHWHRASRYAFMYPPLDLLMLFALRMARCRVTLQCRGNTVECGQPLGADRIVAVRMCLKGLGKIAWQALWERYHLAS